MLEDPVPERRFVATFLITSACVLPESRTLLAARLKTRAETDPRVQMALVSFLPRIEFDTFDEELFAAVATLFEQAPSRRRKLDPILWPWMQYTHDRQVIAHALRAVTRPAPDRMIPYAPALETYECVGFIRGLAGLADDRGYALPDVSRPRTLEPAARRLMVDLVCDRRQDVQAAAFEALDETPVTEDEVAALLGLLHRTASVLRVGTIGRLSRLPDDRVLEIARTLLTDGNARKRGAGLELAGELIEMQRVPDEARALIRAHRASLASPELTGIADRLLDSAPVVTLDDCLGLVPPGARSPLPAPRYVGVHLETDAARACFASLGELLLQHAECEVPVGHATGRERVLLADAGWRLPWPREGAAVWADAREHLPLFEVWVDWLKNRPSAQRDRDGLELVRACAWVWRGESYRKHLPAPFRDTRAWSLSRTLERIVDWLLRLAAPRGGADLLVQHFEDALAKNVPSPEERDEHENQLGNYGRFLALPHVATVAIRWHLVVDYAGTYPDDVTDTTRQRLGVLTMLALERGIPGCTDCPQLADFMAAYDAGLLNEPDFIWWLLTPRSTGYGGMDDINFGPIHNVTRLRPPQELRDRPKLLAAVESVRSRLIEVELTRGDCPAPSTQPAFHLRHAGDATTLFRLVTALGSDPIFRQDESTYLTRAYSLSRLISVTVPGANDSPARFNELCQASAIKPKRLLEVAMFAPQWAACTELALDIPGLEDAVWWIHAHTKQRDWWRDPEIRDLWAARISERTELEAEDLEEGAVDVVWFQRMIKALGLKTWQQLQPPARFASRGGGHKRAQLFADAMLGHVTATELVARIDEKRHQDAVRALGLVPLPRQAAARQAETLRRYERLQAFKRESRKFGSQRQASEGRAVEIGLQNLARTAGYRDPGRLEWAMEAAAVADLARGPVAVTVEETTVSLELTSAGEPVLTVTKRGRSLKDVPARLRKNQAVADLRTRVTQLRRQKSRMRASLEAAMCRGDTFSARELRELLTHPMLRPMVVRLVFIGAGALIGYPDKDGRVLRDHAGHSEPIGSRDAVRIAHPLDLFERGDWHAWQRECFTAERIQPFKQVFRELYPKTTAELEQGASTRRYAGHQVNPRQALALLRQRHWVSTPEEGVRKTFHDEDLIAEVGFQEAFFTPAEIEELTLEQVAFVRRRSDKYERVALTEIPPRLFSEVMRDLDLVVSVAHAGGVAPEASASTVAMRAALLRETCQLLRLANVQVDGHHARIDGALGTYSVHLGSAGTSVLPGRSLYIVAVHSQHRGRLFLPFADDDPKTAEVLSKVLLLARDSEMKDPALLEQIRT